MSDPGPVFLVTGAGGGIGRRLVPALLRRGGRVVATDRPDVIGAAARDGDWPADRVLAHPLDVTDPAAWEAVLDACEARFGAPAAVFQLAAVLRPAWVADLSPEDVSRHVDVNVRGVLLGTIAAARRMLRGGGGHVVNLSSLAGIAPVAGVALYSATKHAVRAFSIAADRELRPRGVAVTVVCPDAVDTPMLDLQRGRDESALVFSGVVLTARAVADLLAGRVLDRRPVELTVPRFRGWLAKLANAAPRFAGWIEPILRRIGRRRMGKG